MKTPIILHNDYAYIKKPVLHNKEDIVAKPIIMTNKKE